MKKAAIVSCYFQKNYGSVLQAYATQMALNKLGIENETINISGFKKEIEKAKIMHYMSRITDKDILFDTIMRIGKNAVNKKIRGKSFRYQMQLRNEKFDLFSRTYFSLSKPYKSKKELGEHAKEYCAFLVGSDQLWLPSNIAADYYTLNFVPDDVIKISYATSFGIAELPTVQYSKAKQFLDRIEYLSVREQSGQALIKKITGRTAQLVCDPTILFTAEDWMSIQQDEPVIKGNYIFCYFLGNNPEQREFVKKFSLASGIQIAALQHLDEYIKSDCGFADIAPYHIGPCEFLNLIRHAQYVFTDSFHASVFSILNQKNFFTFRRFEDTHTLSTNTRLTSLLNLLGLEERLLTVHNDINGCFQPIQTYADVHNRLNILRTLSFEFLQNAFNHVDGV